MTKILTKNGNAILVDNQALVAPVETSGGGTVAGVTAESITNALGYTPANPTNYQNRFDNEFLQIAYSYTAGGGATNSQEHYEHCAKNNYNAVKTDLRLTSDNQLVCCHDNGLTFTNDGYITTYNSSNCSIIHNMTKATFMGYQFKTQYNGSKCHTCDLETYLNICKTYGKIAYINVRGEYISETVSALISALKKNSFDLERVIINSFTKDLLTAIRAAEPNLFLSLVIDPFTESERTTAYDYAVDKKTCQICLYYSNGSHTLSEMLSNNTILTYINNCIDAGVRLTGAQANEENEASSLLSLGFSGIQTRASRLNNNSYSGLDISDLSITTTSSDASTTVTFKDAKNNNKIINISKLQPTDNQVQNGVAAWMDENAKTNIIWSKNIYNPDEAVNGYIASAGQINTSTEYWSTGFMPVKAGDVLTTSVNGALKNHYYRAFYNSNKDLVSRTSGNQSSVTAPSNSAYVRMSFKNAVAAQTDKVMVCANNSNLTYEAYGYHTEGGLNDYLVLLSSNGKKWTLKVSDTGALSTEEIH